MIPGSRLTDLRLDVSLMQLLLGKLEPTNLEVERCQPAQCSAAVTEPSSWRISSSPGRSARSPSDRKRTRPRPPRHPDPMPAR